MIEVTVSLQTKKNSSNYYAVMHWIDLSKKHQYIWKTTGIKYVDESQKRLHKQAKQEANRIAEIFRKELEEKLNTDTNSNNKKAVNNKAKQKFSDYLIEWAEKQFGKKEDTTSATYNTNVKGIIAPYFEKLGVTLEELEPLHIQNFYDMQYKRVLTKGKNKGKTVSKNTVNHYHQNIHKALNELVKLGIIPYNPDDRTTVATPDEHISNYYNKDEAMELLEKAKGSQLELILNLATIYGLRRSEILGLKWSAINFEDNSITIGHKVTQATIKNKRVIVQKDKMKNKSSYRSTFLITSIKELLLQEKEKQERNKKLYGNSYKNTENYICVKDNGELVKPDTITDQVPQFIESVGLRRITLHNLRHSSASILLANRC